MSSFTKWLLLITEALSYSAVMFSAYVVSYIYVLFQSATGFSAVQLGQIASVVGIVALVGYIFGGILADLLPPKVLLIVSHLAVPGLVLYLSTFPSHGTFMLLQAVLGFIAIFLYWTPISKFVKSLGSAEEEGKRFGFFFAVASVSSTMVGLLAVFLTARMSGTQAMRIVYFYFAAINLLEAVALFFLYHPEESVDEGAGEEGKFRFSHVFLILSKPSIWLMGIMGFSAYMTGKMMVYITPYLQTSFGLSLSTATLINAVVNYGVAIFMSPIAGMLTDKLKSASKVLLLMLIAFAGITWALLIIPAKPMFTPLLIGFAVLIAVCFSIDQTNWFTPLSEITIPAAARGTATGIASLMMFCSDAFAYNLFGGFLDDYRTAGYHIIFWVIFGFTLIGIAATLLLRRLIAKGRA